MIVLDSSHLVRALFHFPLKNPFVVSVDQNMLVVSVEYFQFIESKNPLVVSVEYILFVVSVEYFELVKS